MLRCFLYSRLNSPRNSDLLLKFLQLTLNHPRTRKCVQSLHKSIRIYMGVRILGANILYTSVSAYLRRSPWRPKGCFPANGGSLPGNQNTFCFFHKHIVRCQNTRKSQSQSWVLLISICSEIKQSPLIRDLHRHGDGAINSTFCLH